MFAFLTKNWLVLVLALAMLASLTFAMISAFDKKQKRAETVLVNSGVQTERAAANNKVIADVQDAQDAVAAPSVAEQQRVCEKYDRACQNGK